ncbi:MAG: DUF2182 domain-containing protein [Chloroflexia bacterium]|nr:DUF2182 domain-containing protein [Chloroflexia bacterium]MDQ3411665.1 DUF2182 domain-containing protein [Chloroflexota bacterium]
MATARGRIISVPGGGFIWSGVAAAWALALLLLVLGHGELVSHHAVLRETELPSFSTLLLFLVAWQVMTGAMMLPSSLPMLQLFARASQGQAHPHRAMTAFVAAYFAVWTGFALVALAGDAGLHRLATAWPWLAERPWLIAGSVLLLAGAFQFSPLKERCLEMCRNPVQFLWRFYDRGVPAAWRLGVRHGLFCLGCCWALMLTMFAVGVGSLTWMAALTGVMLIEKTSRQGRRLVPLVGGALLLWGALILLHPDWLPAALSGS